jgi:ribosome biogenesis GTPase A
MFSWLDFTIPGFTQRAQWLRSGRGVKTFDCIGLIFGFHAAGATDSAKNFSAAGRCVFSSATAA